MAMESENSASSSSNDTSKITRNKDYEKKSARETLQKRKFNNKVKRALLC